MMKKILIFALALAFFTFNFYNNASSSYSKEEVRVYYNKFYEILDNKYENKDDILISLTKLKGKINLYLSKTKNKNNIKLLSDLKEINESRITSLNSNTPVSSNSNSSAIEYKIELSKHYSYESLEEIFTYFLDTSSPYFLENGDYYSYDYKNYSYFNSKNGIYGRDLKQNGIDHEKALLVKDAGKYYFVKDYSKIKIISENAISGITNKEQVLYFLLDDNKYFQKDYNSTMLNIKDLTLNVIKGATTDDEKISSIYKWIVDNVDYYTEYRDGNNYIFSGMYTFINKSGVCDGYTKLFLYMLSYAGIKDVEVIRGFAYDSFDFPEFGHAWVRIGNYYYDPTFDDPILIGNAKRDTFIYYKLPKELMYTNRFDGFKIINNLDKLSLEDRKKLVMENMYGVYEKYKDYPIMATIKNRIYLDLDYNEEITLDKLRNVLGYYEVNDFVLYDSKGYSRKIASLKYYPTDDSSLKVLLADRSIDFSKMYLLKWTDSNGTDYKLAYDLEFR